jgi:hypothetical protein
VSRGWKLLVLLKSKNVSFKKTKKNIFLKVEIKKLKSFAPLEKSLIIPHDKVIRSEINSYT